MTFTRIMLIGAVALLGAREAAMASDPLRPTPSMPERWIYQPEAQQLLPEDDNWWLRFEDPVLDSLITVASQNNFDLLQASHRREMARLAVEQARSGYWPTLSASASYEREREAGITTNTYNAGIQMNWEVDLFGRIGASVKNKKESFRASRAEYTAAMVSVISQLATYYMNYRVLQTRLSIAAEHITEQQRVLKIAEARHEAGLVSKLDVAQAKTVYLSTQSTIPQIKSSMRQTLTAIATLLGCYPADIEPKLSAPVDLPQYDQIVPAGIPADLLRRRPDIIEAEANLAAAAASVGIAKKEFLPKLTIEGEVGLSAERIQDMGKDKSFAYSIVPTLSWKIFDGFNRSLAVATAKQQMASLMDSYNLTVMNAVGEVDCAMTSYRASLATIDIDTQLYTQSSEAFSLSVDQYKQGLTAFNNVVDAQIDMLNTANSLATAKGNALVALIDLYKALGGTPNP